MCIIAYKPVGESFPTKKQFRAMFANNADGCGYMFADGERVQIRKGFMEYEDFKKSFNRDLRGRTDLAVVFHFRIATHGGVNKAMTQPFPLTAKTKRLKSLSTYADFGIAHNGIIPMTYDARDISDTALFIQKYMTRICQNGLDSVALDIVETCIDSKMAILEPNGKCHILGSKWTIENGIYYSNESFRATYRKWKPTKKTSYINNNYSWDYTYSYEPFDWSNCDGNCKSCPNYVYCFEPYNDIITPREMEL